MCFISSIQANWIHLYVGLPGAVRSLNNLATEVRREQSEQRAREMSFRDRSELVNSRAVWYTIFQLMILGVIVLYQVRYLKRFFQAKKLV